MPADSLGEVALVPLLARALLELGVQSESSPADVYSPLVLRALDRFGLTCLERKLPVVRTVPALVEWCATNPLSTPPLAESSGYDLFLLDARSMRPTRYCRDVAYSRAPGERDLVREILTDLRRRCGTNEKFHQCRRLLLTSGVLDRGDTLALMADPRKGRYWNMIRDLYRDTDRSITNELCAGCGEANEHSGHAPWCVRKESISAERALILNRELLHRVVQPGLGEIRIEQRLREIGVAVKPAPGIFGGLTLPDAGWVVHVSNRTRPEFVVADLQVLAAADRIFVVVPGDQVRDEFRDSSCELEFGPDVEVVTEDGFFTAVRERYTGVPDA
ncbi:hypothetical protein [Nocardia terpenica]|uniref:pPIWI_RE_Y domain-containing protein n=1 Tax=Nocardia terpenica TaxID=455432 RepID=UPI002FDF3A9F